MTPTNKKQLLKVGLEHGIDFDGEGADTVNSRCARFVLLSVASGLRGDQFELGMQAGVEVLSRQVLLPSANKSFDQCSCEGRIAASCPCTGWTGD